MNGVAWVRRLWTDPQRNEQKWGVYGEGETVRKEMNGVGKCCGLLTEPQRKEKKWEVMG